MALHKLRMYTTPLSLAGIILLLIGLEFVVAARHSSYVKGHRSLRRERGLKLQSPKVIRLYKDDQDWNRYQRDLQDDTEDRSRVGAFGHEGDPFLESDAGQMGPVERIDPGGSESEYVIHGDLGSTVPPAAGHDIKNDLVDGSPKGRFFNGTKTNFTVLNGQIDPLKTTSPTAPNPTPSNSTTPNSTAPNSTTQELFSFPTTPNSTTLNSTSPDSTTAIPATNLSILLSTGPNSTAPNSTTATPTTQEAVLFPTKRPTTNWPTTSSPTTQESLYFPTKRPSTRAPTKFPTQTPMVVSNAVAEPLHPSTSPPSELVMMNAKEAGETIVAGVAENLSQGKKGGGVKGASSTPQEGVSASDSSGTTSKGIKGAKATKDTGSWKSTDGAVSSAFEVSGGKGGKGGKGGSKYGTATVSSAFEAGSVGGKGKSKSSSNSASGTGTYVSSGVDGSSQSSPASPPGQPTTVVDSAMQEPGSDPNGGTGQYPPSSREPPIVDCDAIRAGEASTDGDRRYFQVQSDWALEAGADFYSVSTNVQEYLQSELAPAIAGCDINRKKRQLQFLTASALITNVIFGTPTSGGEGSCVVSQVDRCFANEGDVNIYFEGPDNSIGERLLTFLQNAKYNVDGLLGVYNLKVFDSEGDEVGAGNNVAGENGNSGNGNNVGSSITDGGDGSGNTYDDAVVNDNLVNGNEGSGGVDNLTGNEEDKGVTKWSKTVIGVAAGGAFLVIILCYMSYRRHMYDGDDETSSHIGGKFDFEPISQSPPARDDGEPRPYEESTAGWVFEEQFSRTWPINEEHSVNSEEQMDRDRSRVTGIQASFNGDTHECGSGYCEVCGQNSPRIQFISSQPEDLPEDATRNYRVSDTVKL